MTKQQVITMVAAAVLALSSAMTAFCCVWYVWSSHQSVRMQAEIMRINNRESQIKMAVRDSVEYGKKNPAMTVLLQQMNILPASAPATGSKPATK